MSKILCALVVAVLCFATGHAYAQSKAILQSPMFQGTKKCIDDLAQAGRDRGFYTDSEGGIRMIMHPSSQRELHPLLIQVTTCLDRALPKHEIITYKPTGVKSRVWYGAYDENYVWCASNSIENNVDDIWTLGGHGPKKDWYAVLIQCQIGDKIKGFYKPRT